MRYVDSLKREEEVLDFIVESYIEESRPISSGHLRERFDLPYSSATVRNVMEALERKGYLSHVHVSSGRIPTKEGFRHYIGHIKEDEGFEEEIAEQIPLPISSKCGLWGVCDGVTDLLCDLSGYASIMALGGEDTKISFKGTRFILEQPEFEDINVLKNLFYAFEVKVDQLQRLLFDVVDDDVKVLIGDETGLDEMIDCSLVVSGVKEKDVVAALALLGPMRMDYTRAISVLHAIRNRLEEAVRNAP